MFFEMVWRQASSISRTKGMLSWLQTRVPLKSVTAILAFVDLQDEGDVVLAADQGPLEVGDGDTGVRMPDVQADEIAGSGIESVDAGPAAAGRAGLAELDHEAFVHELADEFRDGRDAGVDLFAEGRDAIFPTLDAKAQDGLFQDGILVVFFV